MVLRPGQKGTRKLQEEYGEALLCVRYRYDQETNKRIKTVEIVVEESEWEKPAARKSAEEAGPHEVAVKVPLMREDLVSMLKRKRVEYDGESKQWRMPYTAAVRMGLRRYIVSRTKPVSHSFAFNFGGAKSAKTLSPSRC